MTIAKNIANETNAEDFWEDVYREASPGSSGKPGAALRQFVEPLAPGRALEMGCAKGDDAVWLAQSGWTVLAVDISSTALGYAAANAARSEVADRIAFERHDLSQSFPDGVFDLVTASFFYSPVDFPRAAVLRRGAEAVVSKGHLLIVEHASRAPWSWASPDATYPTAQQTLASLDLYDDDWTRLHVAAIERRATGPGGQSAMVRDNVIFVQRR